MSRDVKKIACGSVRALFSAELLQYLARIAQKQPSGIFLAGGTVRDLLLGRKPADVDLTVACHAKAWAGELAKITGGAYVELGRDEDAARVVWQGETIDFSSFRAGATTIDQELTKRDVTINALGLCIDKLLGETGCGDATELPVIDPLGGGQDIDEQIIRLCTDRSILDDPLRMLRVFRFSASLGFVIRPETLVEIKAQRERISRIATERIAYELDQIMATGRAHKMFLELAATGLLFEIIPELRAGKGMEQPASHHLDVYEHLMETLHQMERIQRQPGAFFPDNTKVVEDWLGVGNHRRQLKWAALFHDIGKPATYGINEDKGGRITFYNHDLQGADIFSSLGRRLRWSKDDVHTVAALITSHMRPFFLANNARAGKLTLRACLRLVRKAGELLPGLFMLAMADALAGKGEGSPEAMEEEVAGLFERLQQVEKEHVAPVRAATPLLTGGDLIQELSLEPGPMFRIILEKVEEAQMEHRISTRAEAMALARECVHNA